MTQTLMGKDHVRLMQEECLESTRGDRSPTRRENTLCWEGGGKLMWRFFLFSKQHGVTSSLGFYPSSCTSLLTLTRRCDANSMPEVT